MTSSRQRFALRWSIAAGIVVGGLLLWAVTSGTDVAEAQRLLRHARWSDVLVGLVAVIAALAAKSARWVCILGNAGILAQGPAFRAVAIGNAGNVLVSHLGEVARVLVAVRHSSIKPEALAVSIVVERVLDCIAILLVATAAVSISPASVGEHGARAQAVLAAGAVSGLLVAAIVFLRGADLADILRSPSTRFVRLRCWLADRLSNMLVGLRMFGESRRIAVALGWSLVLWILVATCILFCMRAIATGATLAAAAVVMAVHTVALVLPAPPGRVGTIQASFAIGLAGSTLSNSEVFAASIIYNLLMTVPVLMLGGALWLTETIARR